MRHGNISGAENSEFLLEDNEAGKSLSTLDRSNSRIKDSNLPMMPLLQHHQQHLEQGSQTSHYPKKTMIISPPAANIEPQASQTHNHYYGITLNNPFQTM